MAQHLIDLQSDILRFTRLEIKNPHHISICRGITAVVGANGAGKTSLANVIEHGANFMTNRISSPRGRMPHIKTVTFTDIHTLTGFKVEYYQQRFESSMNDDVPTVASVMGDKLYSELWTGMAGALGLKPIEDKKVNFLSSGELRKLLIINSLFDLPELLILDNPFIGLDQPSRKAVEDAIRRISGEGISVMLLVSDPVDIPQGTDNVIPIQDMTIGKPMHIASGDDIDDVRQSLAYLFDETIDIDRLQSLIAETSVYIQEDKPRNNTEAESMVSMKHCRVAYGNRVLVEDANWEITRGDRWALMGPNGSGKSTMLSLINADNPQAYSNDISLFGRRRGSGESIWDIKSRIGFLSSEMHLCFSYGGDTVRKVLRDGCRMAINRFDPLTDEEKERVECWLRLFGLEAVADKPFANISYGQQRLVLLIRAWIRQPEMLILDEPMHGLDSGAKAKARAVLEAIISKGVTIVFVTHCPEELPASIDKVKRLGSYVS